MAPPAALAGEPRPLEDALRDRPPPWPPEEAIAAVVSLCLHLEELHQGPEDRLPDRLGPENLSLQPDGRLRVREPSPPRAPDPLRVARLMRDVGNLVQRLAMTSQLGGEAWWTLARCSSGDPSRCYPSFRELAEALRRCVVDRAPTLRPPIPVARRRFAPPPPKRRRLRLKALLVLTLLAAAAAQAWWLAPPGLGPLREPALALAQGRRIALLSQADGTRLGTLNLGEEVGGLAAAPDGSLVLATLPASGRIALVDPVRGRLAGFLRVDRDPRDVVVGPRGEWVFVAHPSRRLVTLVRLRARTLPNGRPVPGALPAQSVGVLAVEGPPLFLASGRDGQDPILYVAGASSVSAWSVRPLEPLARRDFASPGRMALSPGGRRLYVARRGSPRVEVLDARTLQRLEFLPLPEPDPRALLAGPSGVWALLRRGELVALDPPSGESLRLRSPVALAAALDLQDRRAWLSLDDPPSVVEVSLEGLVAGRSVSLSAPAPHVALVPVRR